MSTTTTITAAQAAERAGVSIDTVRDAIKAGRLKAFQPNGKHGRYRIPPEAVDRWVNTPAVTEGLDADGYPLPLSQEDRQRAMLDEPGREPDFTFFRDRAEFLTQVRNPLTGRPTSYSWDMKPIFERYISARLGGQSVAEARESSGYNKRIDPDEGWDL